MMYIAMANGERRAGQMAHDTTRWFLHRNGETGGPYDKGTIIEWIRREKIDGVIRPEGVDPATKWLPLASHAPFACAMGAARAPRPKGNSVPSAIAVLVLLSLTAGGLYAVAKVVLGERELTNELASAVRSPIQLRDEIVSVPARASVARGIKLPYGGKLYLDITVLKGKHINVFVVDTAAWSEFEAAKNGLFGGRFHHFPEFHATEASRSRLSGPLAAGNYYVVLDNPTYGILVESSFDVQLKAELRP
ncbi:MAG: hypothetical protein QM784_30205 [Polyangiaceae bacterium]